MRSSSCFLVLCTVLVPCFSEDAMHSSCASDDDGDDHCEFIQKNVGTVSQHQNEVVLTKKEVGQKSPGAQFPDFFKDISKIITGTVALQQDAQHLKEEVGKFAKIVNETTKDLLQKVTSAKTLKEVTTQVDLAGHKIWLSFNSVLDSLANISTVFDANVGKMLPSTTFKDYLDKAIANIKTEGDALESFIDIKLGVLGNSSICAEAEKRIESLQTKVDTFVKSMSGLSPDGIKYSINKLYELVPEDAQEMINSFLKEMTDAASSFMDTAKNAGKEIYGSFGKALKGHCPNFASFESLAAPENAGIITAIAVSAAALAL